MNKKKKKKEVYEKKYLCLISCFGFLFGKWYRMEEHMRAEDGVNRHLVYMECYTNVIRMNIFQ